VVQTNELHPQPAHNEFEAIVVGYCKYVPVETPLIPIPKAQVSIDSFGDESVYQEFVNSDAVKNYTPV
jgi:hypothetical protein